jgi:hypothetical protein
VLFKFRIDIILLTLCAHTHLFILEVNLNFSKVNLQKPELIVVGEVPHIEKLGSILCLNIAYLLLHYLGLPLGAPFKSKTVWDGVVEKIENRLMSWKKIYLFKGWRLTLIKSMLSSIPIYVFFTSLPFTSWYM